MTLESKNVIGKSLKKIYSLAQIVALSALLQGCVQNDDQKTQNNSEYLIEEDKFYFWNKYCEIDPSGPVTLNYMGKLGLLNQVTIECGTDEYNNPINMIIAVNEGVTVICKLTKSDEGCYGQATIDGNEVNSDDAKTIITDLINNIDEISGGNKTEDKPLEPIKDFKEDVPMII